MCTWANPELRMFQVLAHCLAGLALAPPLCRLAMPMFECIGWCAHGQLPLCDSFRFVFSCTLGPQDYRITTRVVAGQPFSCFLATAHEWGHSLYEQGLPHDQPHAFPWPLGDATSMVRLNAAARP